MKSHRIKNGCSADKEVDHMAPAFETAKPAKHTSFTITPSAVQDLEHSYEEWFQEYLNLPHSRSGVYVPCDGMLKFNVPHQTRKYSLFNCIFSGAKLFSFFPQTEVQTVDFESDANAILSDWAVVGMDLYKAIQKYKIDSLRVHPNVASEPSEPAAAH